MGSLQEIITTTRKLVVCSDPRGVSTCWPLEGVLRVRHRITITGSRWKRLFSFAYFLLLPVNGSIYSLSEIWSLAKSSSNWFWMYSWIIFAFLPTVSTKYPLHQKFRLPYLYFKFACLSKIISALLLLSVPTNCAHDDADVGHVAFGHFVVKFDIVGKNDGSVKMNNLW